MGTTEVQLHYYIVHGLLLCDIECFGTHVKQYVDVASLSFLHKMTTSQSPQHS